MEIEDAQQLHKTEIGVKEKPLMIAYIVGNIRSNYEKTFTIFRMYGYFMFM